MTPMQQRLIIELLDYLSRQLEGGWELDRVVVANRLAVIMPGLRVDEVAVRKNQASC